MNPYSIRAALDRALTHVATVDHGAGPDTTVPQINKTLDLAVLTGPDAPALPPVHVEEWEGRRVVVVIEDAIWSRAARLRELVELQTVPQLTADPLLDPIPPAALAAFNAPAKPKKNRAARRKEARRV